MPWVITGRFMISPPINRNKTVRIAHEGAEMRLHASLGAHARPQTINARHGGNGIHDQGIEGASKPRSMARQWALPKGAKGSGQTIRAVERWSPRHEHIAVN